MTFSINKYTRALTFPDLKKTKAVFAEQCPLVRRLVLRDNKLFADTFFFFLRRLVIIDNKLFADIVFIVFVWLFQIYSAASFL